MNHGDRRLEVSEAAWRVIVREGLDRTSLRAIAQELGCSTGVVTHYFRDKEELILFALEQVFESVLEQMQTRTQEGEGLERLEAMICAGLPLENSDREDWQVWVAFLGYSIGRQGLIQEHRKRYQLLQELIYRQLEELQIDRWIRADLELELEAKALIALVDGIATGVVIRPEQFSPEQQRYLVRRHLQMLAR